MTIEDLAAQRLHNQHLLQNLQKPEDVVSWLGAVQAQDFTGGKWAIGLRCDTTDQAVTKAFNDGKILRTHILRPTWHFVSAEDIRWIQELTAPRVHGYNKYYNKKLGVDEPLIKKAIKVLTAALKGNNHLTKAEIAKHFTAAGLEDVGGLRFTYILAYAELEALICSGAMQGKQQTYALVEDRAPHAKSMPREKALAELTRRFFASHGPAQIADFAWWSSLSTADIKQGIELAKLKNVEIEGKTYYFAKPASSDIPSPIAHLLPNYDEYFIAYKDRSAFSNFKMVYKTSFDDLSYHLLALDGQLAGGWKRKITPKQFEISLKLFVKLTAEQKKALAIATERLHKFTGLPVTIT